jgi:hypothetical protein
VGRLPAVPTLGRTVSASAPEPQARPGCGRGNTARLVVGVRLCWCCVSRPVASETVQLLNFAPGQVLNVRVG